MSDSIRSSTAAATNLCKSSVVRTWLVEPAVVTTGLNGPDERGVLDSALNLVNSAESGELDSVLDLVNSAESGELDSALDLVNSGELNRADRAAQPWRTHVADTGDISPRLEPSGEAGDVKKRLGRACGGDWPRVRRMCGVGVPVGDGPAG